MKYSQSSKCPSPAISQGHGDLVLLSRSCNNRTIALDVLQWQGVDTNCFCSWWTQLCPLNATEADGSPVSGQWYSPGGEVGFDGSHWVFPLSTSCMCDALAEHSESQAWSNLAVLASDGWPWGSKIRTLRTSCSVLRSRCRGSKAHCGMPPLEMTTLKLNIGLKNPGLQGNLLKWFYLTVRV